MHVDTSIDRLRLALERELGTSVLVMGQQEWANSLRDGGKPTRLPRPFPPYRGIEGNADFQYAVASGASFAPEPGFHHVRRDEQDAPNVINVDSYVPILDLPADPRWPELVRAAGLEVSVELAKSARSYVFAYRRNREDHHSPDVPRDIAGAVPREEERP